MLAGRADDYWNTIECTVTDYCQIGKPSIQARIQYGVWQKVDRHLSDLTCTIREIDERPDVLTGRIPKKIYRKVFQEVDLSTKEYQKQLTSRFITTIAFWDNSCNYIRKTSLTPQTALGAAEQRQHTVHNILSEDTYKWDLAKWKTDLLFGL